MNSILKSSIAFLFLLNFISAISQTITPEDGNWTERNVTLTNTSQAELMVRVGDIDNLNFGWPVNFDPFSGKNTPSHGYPWTPNPADPDGTDRIMVITSYKGTPPSGKDGYTSNTSRPANSVRPIVLTYNLNGLTVYNVVLQIFVDDFQAPVWKARYTVTIDNVRVPFLETIINSLSQTGPVGKMISVNIPHEFVYLFEDGEIRIVFDDLTTGAGDGYAIDFVKILINTKVLGQYSKINGKITVSGTTTPLENVKVVANGLKKTFTGVDGKFTLDSIPPGIITLQTYKPGYGSQTKYANLAAGVTGTVDFQLVSPAPVILEIKPDSSLTILDLATSFNATFDADMDTTTFNTNNIVLSDKLRNLSGKFKRNIKGFTFQPDSLFVKNMTYTLTVTAGVKSKAGVNLERDFVWIFKTQNTTGNNALNQNRAFSLYPNPVKANGLIYFENNTQADGIITFYNSSGVEIYRLNAFQKQINSIDLTTLKLNPGIYFVKLSYNSDFQKLIIM